MRFSLRTKLILITAAILSLTTGAGMVASGYLFSKAYSGALQSKVAVTAVLLATQLNRLLAMGIPLNELVGFEEQCREIVEKYESTSYAMVVDTEGKILFHNDQSLHGKTLTSSPRLKAIQDEKEDLLTYFEQGEGYYESLLPVLGQHGQHVADIIIGFPASTVSKQTKRLVTYSVGISLIFFGMALFLLIFALSGWVSNPLVRLLGAVNEVRNKGTDFTAKVEIASKDEIGELASAFNQMTENLRQTMVSKEYTDAIIQGMMDVLMVTDPDSRILTVNRASCELLNYEQEELIGKPVEVLFPPEEFPLEKRLLKERAADRELVPWETSLRTKEGKDVPVLLSSSIIADKGGNPIWFVYVAKDFTARKQAETALQESEDRYRDLVEYSQALLCTHDLEGRILSANQWAAALLKYDIDTLLTMKIQDLLVPETKHLFAEYISEIRRRGSARGMMLVQSAQGEKRLLEYNNTLRTQGVPEPIVRATIYDVTEQKHLEKERERLIQDLQKALAEVKQLSGLLPICASCKKIRDDSGYWRQIESYLHDHSEAEFSHSICPECAKNLYGEFLDENPYR